MTFKNLLFQCSVALFVLCASISATAAEAAFIHYFSQSQELLAWRSFQQGSSEQIMVDFPEPRTLTLSQAQQLQTKLALSQKKRRRLKW